MRDEYIVLLTLRREVFREVRDCSISSWVVNEVCDKLGIRQIFSKVSFVPDGGQIV